MAEHSTSADSLLSTSVLDNDSQDMNVLSTHQNLRNGFLDIKHSGPDAGVAIPLLDGRFLNEGSDERLQDPRRLASSEFLV